MTGPERHDPYSAPQADLDTSKGPQHGDGFRGFLVFCGALLVAIVVIGGLSWVLFNLK